MLNAWAILHVRDSEREREHSIERVRERESEGEREGKISAETGTKSF